MAIYRDLLVAKSVLLSANNSPKFSFVFILKLTKSIKMKKFIWVQCPVWSRSPTQAVLAFYRGRQPDLTSFIPIEKTRQKIAEIIKDKEDTILSQ